jgi:hypothetical protein
MCALHVWFNPELLQGADPIVDKDEGRIITREEFHSAYKEFEGEIGFVNDLERGIFKLSLDEYLLMPNRLWIVFRKYQEVKREYKDEQPGS